MKKPDIRVVIIKDGKYLAEDRHGEDKCYWTSLDNPFVLCFDNPEQANKIACSFPGSITSYIDLNNIIKNLNKHTSYKVVTDYTDGHFDFRIATKEDKVYTEVDQYTYDRWLNAKVLYNEYQQELLKINNKQYERQEKLESSACEKAFKECFEKQE